MNFSPDRLESHLRNIVGERHLAKSRIHHDETGDLIASHFEQAGLEVELVPVDGPFGTGRNVVGRLPGHGQPERVWILGAHYDTVVGTPGADDNGVAVAGLLETARHVAGARLCDTVELVAWDMEEMQSMTSGFALGSRHMAREARRLGRDIRGVLDLEMIGCCRHEPNSQRFPPGFRLLFPKLARWVAERDGRGDFLAVVASPSSRELTRSLERAAARIQLPLVSVIVRGAARLIPDFYRSDHSPFWRRGIPAVMLTDTAEFRSGQYHRATDTVERVDFKFAARVMETTVTALLELAGNRPFDSLPENEGAGNRRRSVTGLSS